MLYATQYQTTLLVIAADTLLDFEAFVGDAKEGNGYTAERADLLDMLGDPMFKGFTSAPLKIECESPIGVAQAINDFSLTLLRNGEAVEKQAEMIEHARLAASIDQPRDRRTLAEVHGLTENDPWDNSTEEQKAAGKKQDEQMKAVREAGGLTGDSFAAKVGDKLTMTGGTIHKDADGEVTGVDLNAIKNTIQTYELVVDGEAMDWKALFDELKFPENRILHTDGNRVVLQLHDFQTGEVAEVLDRQHRTYSLNKQETVTALDDEAPEVMTIEGVAGVENVHVFYSVQIEEGTVHEMIPLLGADGFDTTLIVTMRNIGRGCWLAFVRENVAKEAANLIRAKGHACAIVAINRQGQSIVAGATNDDIRIVDTHEHVEIGPRPWNDRAAEIDAMTDEERAEWRKTVMAAEYLIAVEESHTSLGSSIVYIVPEKVFKDTGELYAGELILDMVPKDAGRQILTEVHPGLYKSSLEAQLLKDNLCRWGFVESLLLRIHINDLMSDQRVDR